jgi:predicted transcriptional regulator
MNTDFSDLQPNFANFIRDLFLSQAKHTPMTPDELVKLYGELVSKFSPIFNAPEKIASFAFRTDFSSGEQADNNQSLIGNPFFSELIKFKPDLKNITTKQFHALNKLNLTNIDVPTKVQSLGLIAVLGYKSLHAYSDRIICLECGMEMKVMSKRHLGFHALSPIEYRDSWLILAKTPLMCEDTVLTRKTITTGRKKLDTSDDQKMENVDKEEDFS